MGRQMPAVMSGNDEGIRCIGADCTYRFHVSRGASVRDLASQVTAWPPSIFTVAYVSAPAISPLP